MRALPDPDSEEMGFLVDQWLTELRQAGYCSAQLEQLARRLARASDHHWEGRNPGERAAVAAFFAWRNEQSLQPEPG